MASNSQKMIFVTVILTIAIPISTSKIERSRRLDDLCSETNRSNECRNILKSKLNRLDEAQADHRAIAEGVADLAIAKSKEMYDKFFQFYTDSKDDRLKMKYISCAKNYYNANCNLVMAQRILDFDEFPKISNEIDDAAEESKKCRREFGEELLDPGRAGDPNEELGLYFDMVRASAGRLPRNDDVGELYDYSTSKRALLKL